MKPLVVNTEIQAPVERVFQLCSDFANLPKHFRGITKVEMLTNGPVGDGTKFKETRLMHGREATEEMTVVNFQLNRGYHLTAYNYGVNYLSTMEFAPVESGTRVTISFAGQPQTLVAKLMSPVFYFMQGMVRKCLEEDLRDLKKAAEVNDQ